VSQPESWPKIAVVGAGAVGGYFGGLLARAGAPVVMIGRAAFVEAVKKSGLFLDTLQFQESVRVEASTELNAVRGAEMVLFCVKTTDNATTARELVPLLAPGAIVLCMQNGVDNVEQIRAAAAIEALPAVVYVAASVPEPGRVKHVGRGDLVVGPENERTKRIAAFFFACRRALPHFGKYRGRTLDQAGVELRAERRVRAGPREIWTDRRQPRRVESGRDGGS